MRSTRAGGAHLSQEWRAGRGPQPNPQAPAGRTRVRRRARPALSCAAPESEIMCNAERVEIFSAAIRWLQVGLTSPVGCGRGAQRNARITLIFRRSVGCCSVAQPTSTSVDCERPHLTSLSSSLALAYTRRPARSARPPCHLPATPPARCRRQSPSPSRAFFRSRRLGGPCSLQSPSLRMAPPHPRTRTAQRRPSLRSQMPTLGARHRCAIAARHCVPRGGQPRRAGAYRVSVSRAAGRAELPCRARAAHRIGRACCRNPLSGP